MDKISWVLIIALCLTIGLMPYGEGGPHIWEKLQMLVHGELRRPLDVFDLILHGTPWVLLILKAARVLQLRARG